MPLEQLLDTPEYPFDKTVTAGLEKYPKVRDAFDGAWGIILAASNADRIEIVHDSYLEGSIKESTRVGTANEEPIETIKSNLDSQFHQKSESFGHRPSIKSIFKYYQEITSL